MNNQLKSDQKQATDARVEKALKQHGYDSLEEVMKESLFGSRLGVPALCNQGCSVEPDGRCQHGNDSILRVKGLI